MTAETKESALSRWSRRKQEARDAIDAEREPVTDADVSTELPVAATEETAEPVLTDADMPPIESLTEDSDFSPFMSSGVSDRLRNMALRKLFGAPVFNIRDGLDEYDEDYTYFEKLGDIVTSDMKHRIEMEEQKLREKLAAESEADVEQVAMDDDEDDFEEDFDDEDYADDDEEIRLAAAAEVKPADE